MIASQQSVIIMQPYFIDDKTTEIKLLFII